MEVAITTQSTEHSAAHLALLTRYEVERRTTLCRTAIYRGMEAGTFPRSVPIGARGVAWVEHEVSAWIAGRIAQHRGDTNLTSAPQQPSYEPAGRRKVRAGKATPMADSIAA